MRHAPGALRPAALPLAADGLVSRLALAIVAAAGILYASIGPVIVSALVVTGAFTQETAGYVFAVNLYGTTVGGLLVVFVVRRVEWRSTAAVLLALLLAADLVSAWIGDSVALYYARFLHGLYGGALLGLLLSVIARTASPERTLAFYIVIQIFLGGSGAAVLTPLSASLGSGVVWLALAAFTSLAACLLPALGHPTLSMPRNQVGHPRGRAPIAAVALALAAIYLYQAGEMAAFAYMIEFGNHFALDVDFIGLAVAVGMWIGGPSALLVAWWSTRSGRLRPVCAGMVLTAASVALLGAADATAYVAANVAFGVMFSLTFPYALGVASELDNSGWLASVASFASSLGLASGPAIAAALLDDGRFDRIVLFAVVAILASAVLMVHPASTLDRRNLRGRVEW